MIWLAKADDCNNWIKLKKVDGIWLLICAFDNWGWRKISELLNFLYFIIIIDEVKFALIEQQFNNLAQL